MNSQRSYQLPYHLNQGVDESNITYLNITIKGGDDPEKSKNATYNENRTVPILDNPSHWYAGLIRFQVPATYIPIFKWATQYPAPLEDPGLTVYMNYNGFFYAKNVEFITKSNGAVTDTRLVWNFTDFILMINQAIVVVFNLIRTLPGFPPTLVCPRFVLDSTTNLISLFCDANMFSGSGYDLMVSKLLYSYFPSMTARQDILLIPNKEVYKIYVFDNIINNVTYLGQPGYAMLQEFPTLGLWSTVQKILFSSSTIPIETELVGGQENITSRVIFDFLVDNDLINDRSTITYNNTGGQRWYALLSSFPMKRTDIIVEYQFNDGSIAPIKLLRNDILTMKMQFVKKSDMTNIN